MSEFAPPPEVQLKRKPGILQRSDRTKPNIKDVGRGRASGSAESNVDESQFLQMKSVFAEGPMMAQAHVNNSRLHYGKNFTKNSVCFFLLSVFGCIFNKNRSVSY